VRGWLGWLTERGVDVLDAGRVHVDLWAAGQQDRGAESSTVRRRLSALSSFYRYCAAHDLVDRIPTAGVARPMVDPDYTATIGLDRGQARALVAAADADRGPQALRTAAVIRLLLHNGLRVDEACAADVADLGTDTGHRVLRVTRKGARKARIPLTPATVAALDAYLADRARRGGLSDARQLAGPLLATASGGRLRQGHLWELVRRLARAAGIEAWDQLSPHCLRHSAITFALDAGAALRDVQDYAGHKDPAPPAATTTPGTAWTATPPTRSRPTSPDRTHSPRPSVARPLRLRPGADPSRASRPNWRGRQRFPPSRLSRSIRPIRPRSAQAWLRSGAGSMPSSTGSPARARASSSAAIAASGDG